MKTPSESGLIRDSSLQLERQDEQDCTTLDTSFHQTQKTLKDKKTTQISATAECLQQVSEMTSVAKSLTCRSVSRTIESLQTLDQASTSEERVSEPFWSWQAKDWCQKLWLPTETGCVASHSNWWNGSFISMESNSWFSMKTWIPQNNQNSPKTSCQSSMFSIAESTVKGSTAKTAQQKQVKQQKEEQQKTQTQKKQTSKKKRQKQASNGCRRVRLHPDPETASKLMQWFGCVRVTYNWTLACIKSKPQE